MSPIPDRTDLWLPLLRELTERYPRWCIWKNADTAFAGKSDIDSFAPSSDWASIGRTFEPWAAREGLGPLIVCRHVPQGPHFIALQDGSPYLVQLDVKIRATFRGSTLVDVTSLLPLSEVDDRGFRRVRPGAEGIIKLCLNGLRRGGRPNAAGLEAKGVRQLLASDWDGVLAAAQLFGPARSALERGARAVVDGAWDRRAMATVERWCFLRAAKEPHVAASRYWFLKISAKRCPVIRLIRDHERRVPEPRAAWLQEVQGGHLVREPVP